MLPNNAASGWTQSGVLRWSLPNWWTGAGNSHTWHGQQITIETGLNVRLDQDSALPFVEGETVLVQALNHPALIPLNEGTYKATSVTSEYFYLMPVLSYPTGTIAQAVNNFSAGSDVGDGQLRLTRRAYEVDVVGLTPGQYDDACDLLYISGGNYMPSGFYGYRVNNLNSINIMLRETPTAYTFEDTTTNLASGTTDTVNVQMVTTRATRGSSGHAPATPVVLSMTGTGAHVSATNNLKLTFWDTATKIDTRNAYNASNSSYDIPEAGYYHIMIELQCYVLNPNSIAHNAIIRRNNVNVAVVNAALANVASSTEYLPLHASIILYCSTGDQITAHATINNSGKVRPDQSRFMIIRL